jgi:hypothetical protein
VQGPGRWDATCRDAPFSFPHVGVMTSAKKAERLFASGNERSIFETTLNNTVKAGYYIKPTDKMHFIVDLMNMNVPATPAIITIEYEYIEGKPEGWSSVKPVWLDADNCKTSEVPVPNGEKIFSVATPEWKANFEGDILGMGAHLHDGGVSAEIMWNGKLACDSRATYGIGGAPDRKRAMTEEHITNMSACATAKAMKKGDTFVVNGKYDLDAHPAMENINNKLSEIMVISVFYVKVPIDAY